MKRALTAVASLRLTLAGMLVLLVAALVAYRHPAVALSWLSLPLGLLGLNLLAAVLTNRAFRLQSALLLFHVGLLGVLVLAGLGVLTRLDARIEVVEGERFDPQRVEVISRGWLYPGGLDAIDFVQGAIAVDYRAGLERAGTASEVLRRGPGGAGLPEVIGDRTGLVAGDHRLLATFNKGWALVLAWEGSDGSRHVGAVNLPSYPEFEWKQHNDWTTPAGETLGFELRLAERVPGDRPWQLTSAGVRYAVEVRRPDGSVAVLRQGDAMTVRGGRLAVADLRLWMGYRIDFNPFLPWILAAALLTLAALGWHFQRKFGFRAPRRADEAVAGGRQVA